MSGRLSEPPPHSLAIFIFMLTFVRRAARGMQDIYPRWGISCAEVSRSYPTSSWNWPRRRRSDAAREDEVRRACLSGCLAVGNEALPELIGPGRHLDS